MKQSLLAELPSVASNQHGWPWTEETEQQPALVGDSIVWPRVTIVTPSFNQGQFLEETIRSVLLQGYPNLEYIVIDGGSTDNSVDIIRKYESCLSFWVSEPDEGQADAINKGFAKSTGEFLGWINSDDYLYPGVIKRVVEVFQANSRVEMIYGDVDCGWPEKNKLHRLFGEQIEFSEMLRTVRVPIPQQGSLWRRSVIDRVGNLDSGWQVVLDQEFFTRVAEKCQILYLPMVMGFFRLHENSKSISQNRQWIKELPKMYHEFFERDELQEDIKSLRDETMGAVFLTCTSIALRCGEKRLAIEYFTRAFKTDPLFLFRRYLRVKLTKIFRIPFLR